MGSTYKDDVSGQFVTLGMMNKTTVYDVVKARGTRIATVTFVKLDGSVRVANGLFRPSSHIVGSERGFQQGLEMQARGQVPFYDLQKKAWISFYADRVVSIN